MSFFTKGISIQDGRDDGVVTQPWENEPDRVEFNHVGFPCLALRGPVGAWCGYVAVPPGHPMHTKPYNAVDVAVHGGLTYAGVCQGPICHKPEPGEPDDVWWLGFDCAHFGDLTPSMVKLRQKMPEIFGQFDHLHTNEVYRDLEYVKNEIRQLAEQLAQASASEMTH
jgi:hypothetical protein